jgi:TRAP-type C4-dicarboxylate transport system permease small subunit
MTILKWWNKCIAALGMLGSLWIAVLMLIVTYDVGGRVIFHNTFEGTPEIVSNSIVAILFFQTTFVLFSGRHINVTVIYDKVPPVAQRLMDILACALGVGLFILLIKSSIPLFQSAYRSHEFEGEGSLRVPTWPVRFIIIMGSVLMVIEFVILLITKIRDLVLMGNKPAAKGGAA